MDKDALIGIAIFLVCDNVKKTKRKKRFWVKQWFKKSNTLSDHNLILQLSSPSDYRNYLRMDHTTFSKLLGMVTPYIEKQYTSLRKSISPAQHLLCTLRYLATGVNFEELKFIIAIASQTLGKIIIETCEAITTALKYNIKASNLFIFIHRKSISKKFLI